MTLYSEIKAFVKTLGRINDTSEDSAIAALADQSYRKWCRKLQIMGAPALRSTATITIVAATQDYALATDFDVFVENSVRYYTSGSTDFTIIPIVKDPDAALFEAMDQAFQPLACRVIAGATGATRKLRLLPSFSDTGKVVSYAYWKQPAQISASSTAIEVPELADAVAFDVLAGLVDYTRDNNASNQQINYLGRAKTAFNEVLGTLIA
jgi:hypothetical protein